MNNKTISLTVVSLVSGLVLALLLTFMLSANAQALSVSSAAPAVTHINPATASNDLNTDITITGTGFTVVITQPTVLLNSFVLKDAGWINSTSLTATVPWGLPAGVYTLTVVNPDGQAGHLLNAFTATQGINVWTTDGPYGGWVSRVVIDPLVTNTLYAAADNAGVFRSRDSGEHWQMVTAANDIGSQMAFNASFSTLYAGGGPHGWARSTDGGDTWTSIGWLDKIFPHPVSDTVAYASKCDGGNLYRSEDSGATWSDAWVTTPVTDSICDQYGNPYGLVFDPTNPLKMYLATAHGNIFRSVDGGANWTFASRPATGIWSMTVNPFGAHEVWIGPDNRWGDPNGLMKSANADLTAWTPIEESPGHKLMWAAYISFAPATWGAAYSGTVYIPFSPYFKKSTDGGATWTVTNYDFSLSDLAFYPTDTHRMYTGGEGVHRSLDGGQTWSPMNTGLAAVTPNQLAVVSGRPEAVYALTDGGLFGSERAGESWKYLTSTAAALTADPFVTSRVYLGGPDSGGDGNGLVSVSDDGGQSWPTSGVLTTPLPYSGCGTDLQVLKADPATPGRLLAGNGFHCADYNHEEGGLYLSTDTGQSWSYLHLTQVISAVNDILYDPQNPAKVYAGTGTLTGDGVLISTDRGVTWHAASNGMTGKDIMSLAAELAAPYRIYAASGYGVGPYVYRSDDSGATWRQMTSPPDVVTRHGLAVMPGLTPVLYAGTWSGLYWSDDGAQSWHRADGPLGEVHIYSLAVATDGQRAILYVGTAGGMVGVAQQLSAASSETLVSAGVYRTTRSLMYGHIYLPFVRR